MPKGGKIHVRKKRYQQFCKEQAKAGKINNYAGMFVAKSQIPDSSMRDDYYPQGR